MYVCLLALTPAVAMLTAYGDTRAYTYLFLYTGDLSVLAVTPAVCISMYTGHAYG